MRNSHNVPSTCQSHEAFRQELLKGSRSFLFQVCCNDLLFAAGASPVKSAQYKCQCTQILCLMHLARLIPLCGFNCYFAAIVLGNKDRSVLLSRRLHHSTPVVQHASLRLPARRGNLPDRVDWFCAWPDTCDARGRVCVPWLPVPL